jgi:hypothetical protein
MKQPITVLNALQALPLEAPGKSLWPSIQMHLPKQTVWPKWAMASAASVVLVLLSLTFSSNLPWSMPSGDGQLQTQQASFEQLIQQSTQLENAFYEQQDDSISSATVIAANLAIEDQLRVIDNQLSMQASNSDSANLWQQRIEVLTQGLNLNTTNAQFNANGQNLDLALASLN